MDTLNVERHPDDAGHENVYLVTDAGSGLEAIIAIHSTRLGPALGGTRWRSYPSRDDAVGDALRLSRAMTYKAAMAAIPAGGGKGVIVGDPPAGPRRERQLIAYARAVNELGGRFSTGEDLGTDHADFELVRLHTPYVNGVRDGVGDPSATTARGLVAAMRAAREELDGQRSLTGLGVVVAGVGKVGRSLVARLVAEGAEVAIADPSPRALHATCDAVDRPLPVIHVAEALTQACDIVAPCGIGGVLDGPTARRLSARAVVGSANNQLADAQVAEVLHERGVLYVPDYVANAGGLIHVFEEGRGATEEAVGAAADRIEETVRAVLARARATAASTAVAADRLAEERLAHGLEPRADAA